MILDKKRKPTNAHKHYVYQALVGFFCTLRKTLSPIRIVKYSTITINFKTLKPYAPSYSPKAFEIFKMGFCDLRVSYS